MENHNAYTIMLAKIRAFRATKDVIVKSLEGYDVTIMQWLMLGAIQTNGGSLTAKVAAKELDVTMPFVTRLTKQLESKKMIAIKPNGEDLRIKNLTLTTKGETLLRDSEPVVRQAIKDWLSEVPTEEVRTYIMVLLRVAYKI